MSTQRRPARTQVIVRSLNAAKPSGFVEFGPHRFACALGRSGVKTLKREGDGATPRGRFPLRCALYNPASARRLRTGLSLQRIGRDDGWCDASGDGNYNRPVCHPYKASAERMWREDGLYDVVVVVGHNDRPRLRGRGSAIFMHVARPGLLATEGCIALRRGDLQLLLSRLSPRSGIVILV